MHLVELLTQYWYWDAKKYIIGHCSNDNDVFIPEAFADALVLKDEVIPDPEVEADPEQGEDTNDMIPRSENMQLRYRTWCETPRDPESSVSRWLFGF